MAYKPYNDDDARYEAELRRTAKWDEKRKTKAEEQAQKDAEQKLLDVALKLPAGPPDFHWVVSNIRGAITEIKPDGIPNLVSLSWVLAVREDPSVRRDFLREFARITMKTALEDDPGSKADEGDRSVDELLVEWQSAHRPDEKPLPAPDPEEPDGECDLAPRAAAEGPGRPELPEAAAADVQAGRPLLDQWLRLHGRSPATH